MFINGTYRILYIDVQDGNGMLPIGYLTSHSFSEDTDSIDSTTRDNGGWRTNRLTNQGYSIDFDGLVLESEISFTKQTYYTLKTIKRDRTLIDWKIDNAETGSGYITSLSNDNSIDEFVSFTAEITGYGIVTIVLDSIYDAYSVRVLADGGSMGSEKCLKNYIDNIIND